MAYLSFTPGFSDKLTGTRFFDIFKARTISSISVKNSDSIANYNRRDVIDLPGKYKVRGKSVRLKGAAFTHDFDTQGDANVLLDRLSDRSPRSVVAVNAVFSNQFPGDQVTMLFINGTTRGIQPSDGLISLTSYGVSRSNWITII